MARLSPAPFELAYTILPSGVTTRSLAAIGTRIFFVADGTKLLSTVVGQSNQPVVLATASACQTIGQVAAAGHRVAYLSTWPVGPPFEPSGCGSNDTIAWSIWMLDLDGGTPHVVSAGILSGARASASPPVHLALGEYTYAFDRPSADGAVQAVPTAAGSIETAQSPGETVEVHSLADDSLLWSTQTQAPVERLMLGGSRIAVLEDGPSSGSLRLGIADPYNRTLKPVASPASTASLSDDGSYLAWDVAVFGPGAAPAGVDMEFVQSGDTTFYPAASVAAAPEPLQPAVSSGTAGPLLAWCATASSGSVYPAFMAASARGAVAIASVQTTAWLTLQGTVLIWVAAAADGSLGVVFAFDVADPNNIHY